MLFLRNLGGRLPTRNRVDLRSLTKPAVEQRHVEATCAAPRPGCPLPPGVQSGRRNASPELDVGGAGQAKGRSAMGEALRRPLVGDQRC